MLFTLFCISIYLQIYPDEGHFLSQRSRIQLTHSLIGYFRGCLLDVSSLLSQQSDDDDDE